MPRIGVVSWNTDRKATTEGAKEIAKHLPADVKAVFCAAQEESVSQSEGLAAGIAAAMKKTEATQTREYFKTRTEGLGQVSATVIQTGDKAVTSRYDIYQDKESALGRNKGGIIARNEVDGAKFTTVSFHLESKKDKLKTKEMGALWSRAYGVDQKGALGYEQIAVIAGPVIIAGDANWRNIYHPWQRN